MSPQDPARSPHVGALWGDEIHPVNPPFNYWLFVYCLFAFAGMNFLWRFPSCPAKSQRDLQLRHQRSLNEGKVPVGSEGRARVTVRWGRGVGTKTGGCCCGAGEAVGQRLAAVGQRSTQ